MNKMIRIIKLVLIVLILIYAAGTVYADGDMVIQLRLYEGFNEKGTPSGVIVSSYYLQTLPGDGIVPFVEVDKEKNALMNIYKLKEVNQIANVDVVLKKGEEGMRQELPLNGRKLALQLDTVPGKKDRFKLEVLESPQKEKPLLETEIIMPEMKTAVMGFKDSAEKIFFLAYKREKDRVMSGPQKVVKPKLLSYESPEYPKAALKKKIEGGVLLECGTDTDGNMVRLNVLDGDPVLAEASKKAALQWKYQPWKIDGVSESVDIFLVFLFRSMDNKMDKDKWLKEYLKKNEALIEKHKKKRRLMEMVLIKGKF